MSCKIPLGDFALVDDEDQRLIDGYSWRVNSTGYAMAYYPESNCEVLMHRLVMGCKKSDGNVVDHINGNKLDNRKENLRVTNQSSNSLNCGAQGSRGGNPSSPYKGVYWLKERQCWGTQFRGEYIGIFYNDRDAAVAYDNAVRKHGDQFARLNFPDGDSSGGACQIAQRKGKGYKNSSSQFRGVTRIKNKKSWATQINSRGVKMTLFSPTEESAARIYDALATAIFGERALLNFPGEPLAPLSPKHEKILREKIKERSAA